MAHFKKNIYLSIDRNILDWFFYSFFKNGPYPASSLPILGLFQTDITVFTYNKLMPKMSIQYTVVQGFKPTTSEHESIRTGLPPSILYSFVWISKRCRRKFLYRELWWNYIRRIKCNWLLIQWTKCQILDLNHRSMMPEATTLQTLTQPIWPFWAIFKGIADKSSNKCSQIFGFFGENWKTS